MARKKKITDSKLEEFAREFENKELTRTEIMEKYDIRISTYTSTVARAREKGCLDEKVYEEWISAGNEIRQHNVLEEKYGKNYRSVIGKNGNKGMLKKGPALRLQWSSAGGKNNVQRHPHVMENLQKAIPYGMSEAKYGTIEFSSMGERLVALVLQEYGLINIERGVDFQRRVERKTVDYYIGKNLVVEFHPVIRNHSEIKYESERQYYFRRKKDLNISGDVKLVVISKDTAAAFYKKLRQLGIKDTYPGVVDKFNKIKENIERHDEFMKDDYSEMDKPVEEDIF